MNQTAVTMASNQRHMITHEQTLMGSTASYELNCKPVPFEEIIKVVTLLPRAHPVRVGFIFLLLTGCRMSELHTMRLSGQDSFLRGNWLFWRVGKNQGGQWRKEFIPDSAIAELRQYRSENKLMEDQLFGLCAKTLGRYFNRDVRPLLGPSWHQRVAVPQRGGIHEFILQVKGIRKSWSCLTFWQELQKWKSAAAALEFTCKRMRHSSTGMTVQHYLSSVDQMDINKWGGYTPSDILSFAVSQKKITDYTLNKELGLENRQGRLVSFMED